MKLFFALTIWSKVNMVAGFLDYLLSAGFIQVTDEESS